MNFPFHDSISVAIIASASEPDGRINFAFSPPLFYHLLLLQGLFSRMTFLDPVFIGGRGNISGLEKLPVQSGYEGCIRSLNVNGRSYSWGSKPHGDAIDGFNIGELIL